MKEMKCKCSIVTVFILVSIYTVWIYYIPNDLRSGNVKHVSISNYLSTDEYLRVEIARANSTIGLPVITNLQGGLGNQLFEFACAYSVAKQRNSDIYVLAPSQRNQMYSRGFVLDSFKINFSKDAVQDNFSNYGAGTIFKFKEQNIWEKNLPRDRVLKVDDVCVSEVYFKEYRQEIKDMFILDIDETPIKEILEKVANSESVSVHVRRGDYIKPSEQRDIPINYQKRAMKWIERFVPNATFFIFSDDLKFVRGEFKGFQNVIFVDNSNSEKKFATLYDFLIMSRCKHNIIANSTFSWWAAYLNGNKDKIVIGPLPRHPPGWNEKMYTDKNFYKYRELVLNYYLYPPDWLTINPFEY